MFPARKLKKLENKPYSRAVELSASGPLLFLNASHPIKTRSRSQSIPAINPTSEKESPDSTSSLFALSATYLTDDNAVEITRADKKQKTFYFLPQLSEKDQLALRKNHPLLAKRILGNKNIHGVIEVPRLAQGTFSFISLAKDEHGKFYAVRKILGKNEVIKNMGSTPIRHGQVLFDTMNELEAHAFLNKKGLNNCILLIEDAVISEDSNGIQICQFLPLADLGNGNDIIKKMSYLGLKEKTILFNYIMAQLIPALVKIHATNFSINDIKPDNILFTSQGFVSFSDFGAASYLNENNKLKHASSFKDKRYLAPYSHENKSPKNNSIASKLKAKQLNDLWSFALTLLEFWDQSMVQDFLNAALTRHYHPITEPVPTAGKEIAVGAYIDTEESIVTHPLAAQAAATASFEPQSSSPEKVTLSKEQLLRIYQEELQRHLFNSTSFTALPAEYQLFFKKMLELNPKQPEMDIALANIMNHPSVAPLVLGNNEFIVSLFTKFLTVPENEFHKELFEIIKSNISDLLDKFSCASNISKTLLTRWDQCSPSDFAIQIMPLLKEIKRSYNVNNPQSPNNSSYSSKPLFLPLETQITKSEGAFSITEPVQNKTILFNNFIDTLEKLCLGELPHFTVLNNIIEIASALNSENSSSNGSRLVKLG